MKPFISGGTTLKHSPLRSRWAALGAAELEAPKGTGHCFLAGWEQVGVSVEAGAAGTPHSPLQFPIPAGGQLPPERGTPGRSTSWAGRETRRPSGPALHSEHPLLLIGREGQ